MNQGIKRLEKFKKVRRIGITQSTDRGTLPTDKNRSDGFVEFESLTEEGLFLLLDHDPHCIDMESQPLEIPNAYNKRSLYVPDAWAKFKDGKQYIFDTKNHTFFESLENDQEEKQKWELRVECVKDYCDRNRLGYEIITNDEIQNERLENIQFFRKNKRKTEILSQVKPIIVNILNKNGKIPRIDLAIELSKKLELDVKEIIPVIDHLIYFDFFLLDFETKITDDTKLNLRSNQKSKITPLYKYFSKMKEAKKQRQSTLFINDQKDPNYDTTSQREFLALPDKIQKEVLHRIEVLGIFNQQYISTKKVKEHIKEHNIGYSTIYRWKKNYEQFGWIGLIPANQNKGRRKNLSPEVENLIQKVIKERYLTRSQPSVTGCYQFLLIECKRNDLNPPHYSTFNRRVQEVSNTLKTLKRRGRKVSRDQYKLLDGEYPFGKHPLDIIEFDHTILDVTLVDRVDRKPIGRPILTLAFDVYSRMIYGYYLSFDHQSLLTVGMCFLAGIKPKDEITKRFNTKNEWAICGLPKRILLDNAKEFLSPKLRTFCNLYGIETIFNPVKHPERKPYVERVFRTINEKIKDEGIGGYVLPLEERCKIQYNPERHAEMTIEEFEQWLVHWIVDTYHQKIHAGIKQKEGIEISPAKRYEQGLVESEGRTVGLPTIPVNLDQLQFDLLPFKKRNLHRYGIEMFRLEYNDPIIAELRRNLKDPAKKFIVRYDPRDIREIYLWAESMGKYVPIPLKTKYYTQLLIDPDSPEDSPLSEKELKAIKSLKSVKKGRATMKTYDLVESMEQRQNIIEEAKRKTRAAKKARKIEEIRKVHKAKATSTEIRKKSLEVKEEDMDIESDEDDIYITYQPKSPNQPFNENDDIYETYNPKGLITSKYPIKEVKED